jgi:phosphoglucosamine mutase
MIRFGTDGIRGPAGMTPCTMDVALNIGRAAVRLCYAEGRQRVMVARDTRASGPALEAGIVAGIVAAGGEAVSVGVLPTAGLMSNVAEEAAEVGVMITASHNPAEDNGFKIVGRGGKKLSDRDVALFEGWLENPAPSDKLGTVSQAPLAARNLYFEALARVCPPPTAIHGARIAVDFANGAGCVGLKWLRDRYSGVDWVFLGQGEGAINDAVGSEHPEALCSAVREARCVAGFAVDGDADRCVIVDETGTVVSGDALTWFLARQMRVDSLAVSVMSNGRLESALPGVRVVRTPVGDKHLTRVMDSDDIPLAAEESGHVLFADGLAGGDGLVTGLRAMSYAAGGEGSLSQQLSGFSPLPRMVGKVAVGDRPRLEGIPRLHRLVTEAPDRVAEGRVLLRYSGTEPVLRILVEGAEASLTRSLYEEVLAVAREELS